MGEGRADVVLVVHHDAKPARKPRGLLPTEGFFGGRPPVLLYVLAVVFVAVVGMLDYFAGRHVSLALFYLMPIVLVTWNLGRRPGVVVAVVATTAGLAVDVAAASGGPVAYTDAALRLLVFLFVVWILSTLKEAIDGQQERLQAEREVADGLRHLNAVKDTLLHAVSHDLKGPLAAILGAMQTLRREEQLDLTLEERTSLYTMIEQSGRKANRLVDDLLDLDRLDRGQVQPDREPTDVGELARRVARECVALQAHPVRVEADNVLVDVDPGKVERIIDNLLVNAARYTPPATPVRISVVAAPAGIILAVEDEGPGVPDDLKVVLFDPFRQGPNAGSRGVGIGLSLVKRFAELHGGTARVEDRAGGGARFVIDLPGEISEKPATSAETQLRAV